MTKDDGRPVTQSQRGTTPGVSGTLTFAEIHFKAIETLKSNIYQIPSFDPTEQFFDGEISCTLIF
jgi:hypothetical protein